MGKDALPLPLPEPTPPPLNKKRPCTVSGGGGGRGNGHFHFLKFTEKFDIEFLPHVCWLDKVVAAGEPIPVTPVEHVQRFKVEYSCQKKWHTEHVSQWT